MKTEELMDLLARGAGPAGPDPALPRLAWLPPLGVFAAALLGIVVLGAAPASLWAEPGPWLKLLVAVGAIASGLAFSAALGRPLTPAARLQRSRVLLGASLVAVLLIAAAGLFGEPSSAWREAWLGHTWWLCPIAVLVCALPVLAATLRQLRALAPTRLRAAGAAAGLLAGGCGAFGYSLTCTAVAPLYIATWYPLGIALCAALGALLGPRLLRW